MKIVLVVTGGIAAIKIYDLVRLMMQKGYEVKIVLTSSAQKFVTKTAFEVLTKNPVYTDIFDSFDDEQPYMHHISLVRWADILLYAPLTANMMAKLSHGLSDDLASLLFLSCEKPVFIAPAMNVSMWEHSVTQENVKKLEKLCKIIMPEEGLMACGEMGQGRMAEPATILEALTGRNLGIDISNNDMFYKGKKILVTAGPTYEAIDPVRYLSNYSSGKQGYAIAKEAMIAGGEVFLITGPTSIEKPQVDHLFQVKTAQEMYHLVMKIAQEEEIDYAICTAAVCDWRPIYTQQKMKKSDKQEILTLELEKNPDILYELSKKSTYRPKIIAGFAAETHNHHNFALEKFKKKNCDMILMNDVSKDVFGEDNNQLYAYTRTYEKDLGQGSKKMLASQILKELYLLYKSEHEDSR